MSLSSSIYGIRHCPYSDMGTEYGHPRHLLNKKVK